ncbi:efflux transporter outer membrane subunit [Empedobacter brevis]|uniref:efflux transporter outer membrane subunit n=1 Tax=Empedobacter brevis TaxID=247 RepID=UPI00289FA422|nr:efflux transporter outer membrane subunit [Empedobacter brevis]
MRSNIKNSVGISLLAILVYSCSITKNYERPEDLHTEGLYRDAQKADSSIADLPWQAVFSDTILQSLIGKGLENNYDLKIAMARMDIATANLKQSKTAFFPTVSADAQVTYSQPSSAQARANGVNAMSIPANTIYTLTASTSWEMDVWGKLSSTKRAALASFLQSDAYRRAVQTQLIASVATAYYQLMAYDAQIEIVTSTIENRRKDVDIVRELKENARATGADVVNSEATVKAAELQLPDLKQARRELENALSILLGIPPDAISRSKLALQQLNDDLSTGVPAQLLGNRPDVQQAEFAFQNAFELTNVARTYFYPNLTISGTGGWATANTLQGFFTGTFYGNLIGGLTQPIFNKGLNKQRLQVAEATQQEAYYTFQNTLLTAGQEVSDALYAYQMALEKENIREGQIADLEKATDFTKELLRYSSNTNYTDVLTAEQNLLSAKLNSISDQLQKFSALVELYRALGGGWK